MNFKFVAIEALAFLFVIGCTSQNMKSSDSARMPSSSRTPSADTVNQSKEILEPDVEARKIELCGPDSLYNDSLSDYSATPTGWYPGRAKILADPHEALLAKILLMQKAKISIDITSYIFSVGFGKDTDGSSLAYLDVLRQAIQRGVNVRFELDALGSLKEGNIDHYMHLRTLIQARDEALKQGKKPGTVDIVVFHPVANFHSLLSHVKGDWNKVPLATETTVNFNRRTHDKIIMIDKEDDANTMAIVGGRNLDRNYYGYPQVDGDTYVDMEILLRNDESPRHTPSLNTTLGSQYKRLFCSKGNRWVMLKTSDSLLEVGVSKLEQTFTQKALLNVNGAFTKLLQTDDLGQVFAEMQGRSGFDYLDDGVETGKILPGDEVENIKRPADEVFVNPDGTFKEDLINGDSVYYQLRRLIGNAQKSVDLCTPYIFITPNERDCLKKWVMEQPPGGCPNGQKFCRTVRIISNSPATSDSPLAMEQFDKEVAPGLMQSGPYSCVDPKSHVTATGNFVNSDEHGNLLIKVYETGLLNNKMFKPPIVDSQGHSVTPEAYYGKLHAKYGIIDGRYVFVGSDNLDDRSRHLNSETTYFFDGTQTATALTASFNDLISKSYLYGDPDLVLMDKRKEVSERIKTMNAVQELYKWFPAAASIN